MASTNPFTAKAKQKRKGKLKPFGASVNGKGKISPFLAAAKKQNLPEVVRLEEQLNAAEKELNAAVIEERKAFAALDKMDLRNQRGSTKYDDAKVAWDKAWARVERHSNTILSLAGRVRRLKEA